MLYLSGQVTRYRHERLGILLTPRQRRAEIPADVVVAADNGCFADPDSYCNDHYLNWLTRFPHNRTLFAVAPDVLGNHAATVARSTPVLRQIRAIGLRAAFVAQDGWDERTTPWPEFDWLFVGGSTAFKFRGGRAAVAAARRHGKPAHMGRVNSMARLRAAACIGCASADGTYLKFGPDVNWPRLRGWLDAMTAQPELVLQ